MMAKEATLQVRMDAEMKEKAELLYHSLGTSFPEAVRMFAKQSIAENGMPFQVTASKGQAFGIASVYADAGLITKEKGAYARAMEAKHALN
jgi:addiction module RelB/DinJ family antitoxin